MNTSPITLLALAATLVSTPAVARPGFYVELGTGGHMVGGDEVPLNTIQPMDDGARLIIDPLIQPLMTTETGNGPLASLRLGYNILGYAAVELGVSGSGTSVGDSYERTAAGHVGLVVKGYPLWHFKPDFIVEPWLLIGGGWTIQTQPLIDHIAWDGAALHLGLGVDYYPLPWLSVTADLRWVRAAHARFWFDSSDGELFPLEPKAVTNYVLPGVSVAFHFTAAGS